MGIELVDLARFVEDIRAATAAPFRIDEIKADWHHHNTT